MTVQLPLKWREFMVEGLKTIFNLTESGKIEKYYWTLLSRRPIWKRMEGRDMYMNYRDNSLLSIPGKLYCKAVLE